MKREPKRILHVLGKLNRGGAETLVMNLYRNIDRNKFQFDFVIHTDEKGDYTDEILKLGGKIYSVPKYKVINHIKYKKAWKGFFDKHKEYQIIHGHVRSTASIYLKIAKKYGLYTIAHSHSISSGKGLTAVIKNILQYRIRYVADYFIGCSQKANEWLFGKKVANSNKCEILENGIYIKKFLYNEEKRKKIRDEMGIENNEILIGHVGRFSKVKNHKFLIDIFKEFYKKNSNSKLILLGNGELKENIKERVVRLGLEKKVIFHNVVDNIEDYYNAMDAFVFPSLYEGLGMVVIEAQINGLKCYVSNNIPKCTNIDGKVKFISLRNSSKYWSKLIDKMQYPRKIDIINFKDYDIMQVVKKIEKIYLKGIEQSKVHY